MHAPTRYRTVVGERISQETLDVAKAYLTSVVKAVPGMPEWAALALDDNCGLTRTLGRYSVHYTLTLALTQKRLTESAVKTMSHHIVRLMALAVAHSMGEIAPGLTHRRYAAEVLLGELRRYQNQNQNQNQYNTETQQ